MPRRTPLFSLSALTRAYQRQLGALARTATVLSGRFARICTVAEALERARA